jgi:hypothetical protein
MDLDGVQALGHYIQEVIRHPHLQAFVKKSYSRRQTHGR